MHRLLLSSAIVAVGLTAPVFAHHAGEIARVGDLVVSHAWMHENADMAHSSSVYLTIDNEGDAADRLVAAEVEFADAVVFQAQTVSADGVLEVRDVNAFQVNAGQVLTLKPGVAWIELESVQRAFEHGEHFDMTLTFERAGTVAVEVEIEPVDEDEHEHDEDEVS